MEALGRAAARRSWRSSCRARCSSARPRRLADEIAAQLQQDTRYVILDLRRITEIDSTGAQILLEINAELAAHGQHLLLVVAQPSEPAEQLAESGVVEAVDARRACSRDLDRALEWAEDDLLRADGAGGRRSRPSCRSAQASIAGRLHRRRDGAVAEALRAPQSTRRAR